MLPHPGDRDETRHTIDADHERSELRESSLRVGFLADTVDRPGGIGRYTREVLAALGRRDDVRLVVAAPGRARDAVAGLVGSNLDTLLTVPAAGQLGIALWERYASGARFARAGVDLVHGTKHLVPRGVRVTVLTVHDVMTLTRAHEARLAKRLLLPAQYRATLSQATGLVAVSAATRDRLGAIDHGWAAKTVVVPNGLSEHLLQAEAEPVTALDGKRFALVVGDLSPRKNVALLLDLWEEVSRGAGGLHLAVLGGDGPHSETTRQRLAGLADRGLATWVHESSDAQLRWCYEHAGVVLFPSVEEGFGFPVLEALAFGAPVLASTDPALVEVSAGSDRVRHLDPRDAVAWREAIIAASAVPRDLPGVPMLPAGAWTWDEHAAGLVAVYRRLLGRRD